MGCELCNGYPGDTAVILGELIATCIPAHTFRGREHEGHLEAWEELQDQSYTPVITSQGDLLAK